jgi:Response regulator containing a CheY-like receiver domain and an HTH DNA-binding domain
VRTVVIVDDHETFRATARQLLSGEGFVVVGEAYDVSSAVETVSRLHPDVLLLDVMLPGADGFAVVDMLALAGFLPDTVLISSRRASTFRRRLAATPARGFLSKADLSGAALEAILTSERA